MNSRLIRFNSSGPRNGLEIGRHLCRGGDNGHLRTVLPTERLAYPLRTVGSLTLRRSYISLFANSGESCIDFANFASRRYPHSTIMEDGVVAVREEVLGGEPPHKIEDSTSVNDASSQQEENPSVIKEESMTVDSPTTMEKSIETLLKDADPEPAEEMASPSMKVKQWGDYSGYELGGKSEKPAYCLLDGFMQEGDDGVKPFRVAIDRLPATLGRSHITSEPNFFGLGKSVKALSRFQCRIDYRVPSGTLGQWTSEDEFTYRAATPEEISNPTDAELSESGIYAITNVGKNPIRVNGIKVELDETCLLPHGSTLKFSAFSVYFLLPKTKSTKTMELPLKSKRKRKFQQPDTPASASPPNKKSKIPAFKTMQEELECMSTEDLLSQLQMADEKNIWDRRCQFMGATISYRAARDAAQSSELQTVQAKASATTPGISKQEVVQWIQESDKYESWSEIMKRKLEPKSYQTNIAKAMQRAGYERSTHVSVGRHVRWYLPADLCPRPTYDEEANEDGPTAKKDADSEGSVGDEKKETESGGEQQQKEAEKEKEDNAAKGQEDDGGGENV